MALPGARVFWHAAFAVFLAVYLAILGHQLGHGLASLDAHAIVKVTRELVDQGHLELSRPPGHPTTEIYLFPALAWVLRHGFNTEFDERVYLIGQAIAGLAALCVFYALLLRLGIAPWKSVLAAVCLALSPQFFFNTVDGEEFVVAIFFLLLSICVLTGSSHFEPNSGRSFAAICLFALATGCRPEVIFAGFLFPLYSLIQNLGWRAAINLLVIEGLAIALVWLPILLMGLHPPYPSGMNVSQSILGGAYRLVFQSFTLPVFALICWVLIASWSNWRRGTQDNSRDRFVFVACCITPIVFFAALFLHASKPSHVLFALPFALMLAVRRSARLLVTWSVAALIGFFVTIDIFKERQLGKPHLVAGGYFEATRAKPFYKLDYIKNVVQHCGPSPTAIIADVWPWDVEYHIRRGTLSAEERSDSSVPVFQVGSATNRSGTGQLHIPQQNCVLLPRDGALHSDVINNLAADGYALQMDATLYRTLFARYDVTTPPAGKGQIGNTIVELFAIKAPWR